jgi:GTP-binding protein
VARSTSSRVPRIVEANFVGSSPKPEHLPDPVGVEIAFCGRSNVGKSSLLNALMLRRNLARTSNTPGCTRQIAFFQARASDGTVVRLVDLPGYGYARRSKSERISWGNLVEEYLLARPTLAAVVALVDVRRGVEADDEDLLNLVTAPARVSRPPLGVLLVATKLDKLPRSAHTPALQRIRRQSQRPTLGFSVKDPDTHDRLWQELRRTIGFTTTAG